MTLVCSLRITCADHVMQGWLLLCQGSSWSETDLSQHELLWERKLVGILLHIEIVNQIQHLKF